MMMHRSSPDPTGTAAGSRHEWLTGAALFICSFAWFWFWRTQHYTGGDSGQWDRTIYEGWWLQRRQMLSFATMQLSFQVMNAALGWTSMMSIGLVSCLSGATGVVILWRMLHERAGGPGIILAAATAGFTVIYYGHIETYAMSVTAMLFHLLALQRTIEGRWAPWTVAATFSLMLFSHLIAIFLLPAALLAAVSATRKRAPGSRGWGALALAVSPVLVVWFVGFSGYVTAGFDDAIKEEFFVVPPARLLLRPWLAFTHVDARGDPSMLHKARFMIWNAGAFAPLVPWVAWRFRREMLMRLLALNFLGLLAWYVAWAPLQYAEDFDLFCMPWVIGVTMVGFVLDRLPRRATLLGVLLGVNLALFLQRPAVYADLGRSGVAEITLVETPWLPDVTVFLDESFKLPPGTYRHLPDGAHLVTIRRKAWPMIRRVAVVNPGEHWRIEVGEASLNLVQEAPGPKG